MAQQPDILARSTRDEFYRSRIERMRQHVERGELLASAMRQIGGFRRWPCA